jgi:hypothetical protein
MELAHRRRSTPRAIDGLMCRNTLSVGWDGRLYDCDFNQMLDLPVAMGGHVADFDPARARRPAHRQRPGTASAAPPARSRRWS